MTIDTEDTKAESKTFPASGGTDIMFDGLRKRVDLKKYNVNIIKSVCSSTLVEDNKPNIVWQHLSYDQPYVQAVKDKYFLRQIEHFVYISRWQLEKFRYVHTIPLENVSVIKNAISPIEYAPRPRGEKVKLIYTSAPNRGLDVLLDAFELVGRDDVELDVYSSTIIYGSDYDFAHKKMFAHIIDRAKSIKNVNYAGYAANSDVIGALMRADVFAYPSTFEETSCLAMIEAGAAGCMLLTTDIGALPETGSEFARLVTIQASRDLLVKNYAAALDQAIDDSKAGRTSDHLKMQSDFFNHFYSWESRKREWERLLDAVCSAYYEK